MPSLGHDPASARRPDAAGRRQMHRAAAALSALAMAFTLVFTLAQTGQAQDRRGDHDRRGGHDRRGDMARFHDRDFGHWQGGRWQHAWHNGRFGWWWVAPGLGWYSYAAPVYPYPSPYIPPVAVAPEPAGEYWYYCANPVGYYPYVPRCYGPWQPVPAR